MAILAPLFALLGRFLGRVLTTTLGWASIMLFGRVPQSRQVWLAVLTFGSLAWLVATAGIVLPAVGVFLLTALPLPSWLQQDLVRLAMVTVALLLPAVLGAVSLLVADPEDRPRGRAALEAIARGYLLTPALAATLVILAVAGTVRKIDSAIHRRTDAHLAMVVRPGRYETLVGDVEASLQPELVTGRRPGPDVLTVPARMLAAIAEGGFRRLVPDQLIELVGPDLTVFVYPADLAMTGSKAAVAHARAIITRDVRSVDAWFTTTREAQAIEDRLVALEREPGGPRPAQLDALDRDLVALTVSQDEWEVLYRRRLQLVTGGHADLAAPGTPTGSRPAPRSAPTSNPVADGDGPARDPRARHLGRPRAGTVLAVAMVALVAVDLVLAARGPRHGSASRTRSSRALR
jgi:hypothetical protein